MHLIEQAQAFPCPFQPGGSIRFDQAGSWAASGHGWRRQGGGQTGHRRQQPGGHCRGPHGRCTCAGDPAWSSAALHQHATPWCVHHTHWRTASACRTQCRMHSGGRGVFGGMPDRRLQAVVPDMIEAFKDGDTPSVRPEWAQQQQFDASSAGLQMPPSGWQLFQGAGTCRSQPGRDASGVRLKSG